MFWKKHRVIIVAAALLLALLIGAFWLGGDSPNHRGFHVERRSVARAASMDAQPLFEQQTRQDTYDTDGLQHCTVSISCATLLTHMDWLPGEKAELVPEDGWILKPTEVAFHEGESTFDVLLKTCREQQIHMEYSDTPLYNSAYIEGIGNLYQFDCGADSGWMYAVNGWFPNFGCSRYQQKDGDVIEWKFTCDLGFDIDANYAVGG